MTALKSRKPNASQQAWEGTAAEERARVAGRTPRGEHSSVLSGGRRVRAETTAGQPGGHGHSPMRTGEPSRAEPRRRAHGGPQMPEPRDNPGGSRQCHKGPGTADWRAPETQKPGSCLRRASPQTVGMVGVDALDRKRRPGDTGRGWPSGLAAGPSPARCTALSRGLLGTQPVDTMAWATLVSSR